MVFKKHITFKGGTSESEPAGILDLLPVLVLISDTEGRILFANDFMKDRLNLRKDNIIGRSIWDLHVYDGEGENIFYERIMDLKINDAYSYQIEANFINNDSKWLDVNVRACSSPDNGDIIIWVASDIDDMSLMETELARSDARSRAIFESVTDGIFISDSTWTLVNSNSALEKLFGYDRSELKGEKIYLLIPSLNEIIVSMETDTDLDPKLKESLLGYSRQFQAAKKDGTLFPVELNLNEVELPSGSLFIGLIRDVSKNRELERQILKIAESERLKIGQELHDGVGQMLSAINLMTNNLSRKLKSNALPGSDELDEIIEMVKEADQEVRHLAHGLAHIELQNEGLMVALKRMCERFNSFTKTDCKFDCSKELEVNDKMTALHLFRIIQEAVKNAITHGHAENIKVRIEADGDQIYLEVEDNGCGISGFEDNKVKGMGLSTMQYRAELLGGTFNLKRTSEGWTRVSCLIPFNK